MRILIATRSGVTEENIRLDLKTQQNSDFFYVHLEKWFTRIGSCLHAVEYMYLTTLPPCGVHTLICYLRAYQQMIITLLRTTSDICLNHFLVSPSIPLYPHFRSTEYGEKRLMTK